MEVYPESIMSKRNFSIDLIKFLSILSVVIMHSISVETQNKYLGAYTLAQAVPLFLIVYGFNFYNSASRKEMSLAEQYRPSHLWKKLSNILLPFLLVYGLELVIFAFEGRLTLWRVVWGFLRGGYGPGSYYVVWLFTLALLAPLLHQAVRRAPKLTLVLAFLLSFLGEFLIYYYEVPNAIYRLTPLRFLLPLVLGLYYGFKRPKANGKWFLLALLSMVYILLVEYLGLPSFAHPDWRSQNTLSYFYPFFIFLCLEPAEPNLSDKAKRWVTTISRTTYHIFLIQMFYFGSGISRWVELNLDKHALSYISTSLAICVTLGVVFYYVEKLLKRRATVETSLQGS